MIDACGAKTTLNVVVRDNIQCTSSSPYITKMRRVRSKDQRLSLDHLFFLPSPFPLSPPRKHYGRCKKKNLVIYLLSQIRFSFFLL